MGCIMIITSPDNESLPRDRSQSTAVSVPVSGCFQQVPDLCREEDSDFWLG